jgi:RNA polymerase sigma factor (TIGR02999 family)
MSHSQQPDPGEITLLLESGEPGDAERLLELVYAELERLAQSRMLDEKVGHTMQPGDLVGETIRRLLPGGFGSTANRKQFFGLVSTAMRHVLVDHARRKQAQKHGGGAKKIGLTLVDPAEPISDEGLLHLSAGLEKLKIERPDRAQLIDLKFWGEMTNEELAEHFGVSLATIKRQWSEARAWLKKWMDS